MCSAALFDGASFSNGAVLARGLKLATVRLDALTLVQERVHTLDLSENMYVTCSVRTRRDARAF